MSGRTSEHLLSMPNPPVLTLRECSYDAENDVYLVDCEDTALCCDEIVRQCNAQVGGIREPPLSVDAIFVGTDVRCMFIEFKNRAMGNRP